MSNTPIARAVAIRGAESVTAPDRCPTCDREGKSCPTLDVLIRSTVPSSEARRIALDAMRDCRAHAVDWRARALAAEADADSLAKASRTIDAILARLGARDTGTGWRFWPVRDTGEELGDFGGLAEAVTAARAEIQRDPARYAAEAARRVRRGHRVGPEVRL